MSLVDDALFAAGLYDAAGASLLAALYTEPAVLSAERARLFSHSWALVAAAEEVRVPGSYVTAAVGGIPLAVVRGHDGVLRAFHNVCRHRGITLLEGAGTVGRFMTCPYHQWSYASTGELARVPQAEDQFPSLEPCDLGLVEARVTVWCGMVFVNPWAESPPLAEEMAGLDRRLEPFLAGPLRQVAVVHYEAACNWKLLVENHIDVYHLWYLHAKTLAVYDHQAFSWEPLGDNWWSLEPLKVPPEGTAGWVPPDMRGTIGAYLLFPNLMLVTTDDYFASYDAVPVAPDRTRLTLRVRAPADADADALVASIRSFMAEDVAACERMQLGAASPWFGVGALATTHEEPIRRFHAALRAQAGPVSGEPERPAELSDVQGTWRRDGRRVDDGPWDEVSDVLWLQVGADFCDQRLAFPGTVPTHGLDLAEAFSGTVEVAHGDIVFHHDLDSLRRDPSHPDVSTVHRVAEAMYERGPGFEERWVLASLPDDDGAVAELSAAGGDAPLARIVRVGALALAVWGGRTPGGARYAGRHGWAPEHASYRDRSFPDVDEAVRALAFGDTLPDGWRTVATMPA